MTILILNQEGDPIFSLPDAFKEGHEVLTCADKILALELLKSRTVDFVMMTSRAFENSEKLNFSTKGLSEILEELERQAIFEAMEKTVQNQTQAAKLLKITRGALQYKLKKYALTSQVEKIAA